MKKALPLLPLPLLLSLAIFCAAALPAPAQALDATEVYATQQMSAEQEQRYRDLSAALRCMVCQNQSLADSNADLARDMRAVVRQMIKDGAADSEITDFIAQRYGDFALYRPPLRPATIALWGLPFLTLATSIAAAIIIIRRRKTTNTPPLSEAERKQAQTLLEE